MEETRLVQVLERLTVVCEKLEERASDHEKRIRDIEKTKWEVIGISGFLATAVPFIIYLVDKSVK